MNTTQLQKTKARLHLSTSENSSHDGHYSIYTLQGQHTLGQPYHYTLSFVSASKMDLSEIADTDIKILLQDEKDTAIKREIYAKVFSIQEEEKVGDKYLYSIEAVHPLYYLGLTKRYEIYQEKNTHAIIDTLLGKYKAILNLDYHTNIRPDSFITREYTTQYGQSDLAFIQMLCEQEGITLWMKSDSKPYVVRLAHINETYTKMEGEHKCHFRASKTFSPTHAVEDYYDFKDPSKEYLNKTGAKLKNQNIKDNKQTSQLRHDLEVMHHHDRLEESRASDIKNHSTQTMHKQYSKAENITGTSLSLYTEAGLGGKLFHTKSYEKSEAIFTTVRIEGFFPNALEEYTEDATKVKQYLFECSFEATPKNTHFVPSYNILKPTIPSAVTAIVSSGSAETASTPNTIDIDALGRIRVIFHFDNKYPTSAYIRFTNFSAGDGWGSQFIPRVNTEVVVNFLNGDPDRPVAIGSLYNGNNAIPEGLPANKTKSYIKTRSMPGGEENFNMLLFEDMGGNELVHMQAEKNHLLHAKNDSDNNIDHDERTTVGNDRTENVGNNETISIGAARTETVGSSETISIGTDRTETVGANETITIGANRTEKVGTDEKISIGANRTEDVGSNETITIGSKRKVSVGSSESIKISKNQSIKVGKNQHETVGMFKTETIALAKALTVGLGYQVTVGAAKNETVGLSSSEQVGMMKSTNVGTTHSITAGERFEVTVGSSSLILNADGTIILKGINVLIEGSEHVEVKSELVDIN